MRERSLLWLAVWAALMAARAAGGDLRVLQRDSRATFYAGIAAPPSAVAAVRAFNRSLEEISKSFFAGDYPSYLSNITLQPFYIELPENERFSASVLERSCAGLSGRRVAVLLVCGGGTAAVAVSLAASRAGVPVLRVSPSLHYGFTLANELLPLEIRLEITVIETLHALRATLLHTHWHTFTVLSEEDIHSTLTLRKELLSILTTQPLLPTFLPLPANCSRLAIFRVLANVTRQTRGVVVLICDVHYIKLIMDEAKRLNMLDGHFFWLWIDTTRKIDVFRDIDIKTENNINRASNVENFERAKRVSNFEDNKVLPDLQYKNNDSIQTSISISEESTEMKNSINVKKKYEFNSFFKSLTNDIKKADTHIVNNKLLYLNYSQSYNGSQNISTESLRDFYIVNNNKGVETSKIENNSIEKVKKPFINKYNKIISNKIINETFNKYVNSIDVDEISSQDILSFNNKNVYYEEDSSKVNNEEIFASDEFILNPSVHIPVLNSNIRDNKIEKRRDRSFHSVTNDDDEINEFRKNVTEIYNSLSMGLLALRPQPMKIDPLFIKAAVNLAIGALRRVLQACDAWSAQAQFFSDATASCWDEPSDAATDFSAEFVREARISTSAALTGKMEPPEPALTTSFTLLNLVSGEDPGTNVWNPVGNVFGHNVQLHTIVWPGGHLVAHGVSAGARTIFRIVTALAPPFVMEGELDEDGQCLRGLLCHRPLTSDRDNLTLAFNDLERDNDVETENFFFPTTKPTIDTKMVSHCCYGFAMDLLENIAQELEFDFHLYVVEDGHYGSRKLIDPENTTEEPQIINTSDYYVKSTSASISASTDNINYREQFWNGYTDFLATPDTRPVHVREKYDPKKHKWSGIMGDLISGTAHMSFAAISVSSARAETVEFSQPYFFSSLSILAAPNQRQDIPLLAFLLPFSPELWIAIFTSLNVTAIAVAIYEWLSPFGLNPWGRQRSKNFSISSALWVMWGLLCGHLVAFKAPKSWPNKFLINVWGGFSVIFVASYTANIAALIAGLFFHNAVDDYQGRSNWLSMRVGTSRSSVSEYLVQRTNPHLAQHMRRYALQDVEEGIQRLRNGSLDLLIADTPILDYYRATDHGCKLQRIGEQPLAEDAYAIAMTKGFPLKDSISAVIAKYSSNGYMDILTEKWYGGLPCFKLTADYGIQPRPLGVAAVAGVFILLGVGMVVGCLILILEHLFYKYTLPVLRHQPKGTIWRSRNIMFFSQKLYRFINCVELVSPHHAARELVNTIRQGHFTSLFQKSVKRKEHEQRRRRKSKAQFFEMIQEIRRVQQGRDRSLDSIKEHVAISEDFKETKFLSPSPDIPGRSPRQSRSPNQTRSPRSRKKRCSLAGLNVRRFSTDSILGSDSGSIYERTSLNIGRRLSRDVSCLTSSPPDINTRLRTPSPMIRRAEGSSTRSYQDVSQRTLSVEGPTPRTSIEIMVSDESEVPPAPPYPRVVPVGARSALATLPEDELMRLWRSSEREVRAALLAAIQEKKGGIPPDQDPG